MGDATLRIAKRLQQLSGHFDSPTLARIIGKQHLNQNGRFAAGRVDCQKQTVQDRNGVGTTIRSAPSRFCELFDQENVAAYRSEERRVGKGCRARGGANSWKGQI